MIPLLAGLLLVGNAAWAYSGALEDVTLSAVAERKISPDMAYLNYTVIGQGPTSKEAVQVAANKTTAIKTKLLREALSTADFEQKGYHINPVYNDKRKITGYKVENSIRLRVEKLGKLGDIIDDLAAAGVDRVGAIEYSLRNKELYQNQLLQEAVRIARNKAGMVAEAGGRTLGRMLSVRVNSYSFVPRVFAGAAMKNDAAVAEMASTALEGKDIDVRADVEAVFALE